jgi:ABC-2 type transport system permease protein
MIRLLGAEVNRLRSRRFTFITLLAVVMILSIFQLQVNSAVSPPSAEAVAANQAQYERDLKEWEQHHEEWEQQCVDAGQPKEQCAGVGPTKEDYGLQAVPFDEVAHIGLLLGIYLTGLAMFLVAASFIGAEFTTGAIANWLSFLPRRVPVFASKLITVTTFALLVSVLASAFVLAMAALLTSVHGGEVSELDAQVSMAGRGVAIAGALAVVGFCVGLITRHTAAALGVLLGYLFVWFIRNAVLGEQAWAQRLTPWSPEANLAAIVDNGYQYAIPVNKLTEGGLSMEYLQREVTLAHGAVYWAVLLAGLIIMALLIFRRRDVT